MPLFVEFIFPSFPILFLPFLDFLHILTSQLLVEFMDSLDDVQFQIVRWLDLGFGLRFGLGFRFRFGLGFGDVYKRQGCVLCKMS